MNQTFQLAETHYNTEFGVWEALRNHLAQFDQLVREYKAAWQEIHSLTFSEERAKELLAETSFAKFHPILEALNQTVPQNQYYKYSNRFSSHWQNVSFLFQLRSYFESKTIGSLDQLKNELNLAAYENLHFPLEEYLMGICTLTEELSRYATNCVTRRSFSQPAEILEYLNRVFSGMGSISFKNSDLRRKYDTIKYRIKDVESVVYDLTLRNLITRDDKKGEDTMKE